MVINELREDMTIEFARMDETLKEIRQILNNHKNGTLTRSDVVAGATYLAQCYGVIENILKRIIRYAGLPLPSGPFWHAELVGMFISSESHNASLPVLADAGLFPVLTALRKFRHTVAHGYAVSFDKDTVVEILPLADSAIGRFRQSVEAYLKQVESRPLQQS